MNKLVVFASVTILAVTMTMATPATSHARKHKQASAGRKLVDATLVRPISMVLSLVGTGLYLGTTPLTVPTGIADETAEYLYRRPWEYTHGRPLGSWD